MTVAGRRIDLVAGCTELGDFRVLASEARRLVEREHVDAVVGPGGGLDGLVVRELARRYPAVAFVVAGSGLADVTAVRPAANVFRFQPDDGQAVAGLGTYARRALGWRTANVVADDEPSGWAQATVFAREFCAAGGRVTTRLLSPFAAPGPLPRADGTADLLAVHPAAAAVLRALARTAPPPARLVLGPRIAEDPFYRSAAGPYAAGAVAVAPLPLPFANPAAARFERAYARAFPDAPPAARDGVLTHELADAVEAVVRAVTATHGDTGTANRRLLEALAAVRLVDSGTTIELGAARQAVARTALVRVRPGLRGAVGFELVRTLPPTPPTAAPTTRPPAGCPTRPSAATSS